MGANESSRQASSKGSSLDNQLSNAVKLEVWCPKDSDFCFLVYMRFPKFSSFEKMGLQTVDYFFHFNNYLSVKLPSMHAMEHVFVSASGSLRGLHRFFAFSLNTL